MLNPSYGKNFVRSARWAADYLAIATEVLEKEGHEVKLLDAASLNIDFDSVKEIAREFNPDLS
jgi:hypothetical protein